MASASLRAACLVLVAAVAAAGGSASDFVDVAPSQGVPQRRPHAGAHDVRRHARRVLAGDGQVPGRLLTGSEGGESGNVAATIDLVNFETVQFFGDVAVGTPAKAFPVLFDTGSAHLWLMGAGTAACIEGKSCYSEESSSTWTDNHTSLHVEYGSGVAEGTYGFETVSLGTLTVTHQPMGVITNDSFTEGFQGSGLVGMQLSEFPGEPSVLTFPRLVLQQKGALQNRFAFYLSREGGDGQSRLMLGGYDESLALEDMQYADVITDGFWGVGIAKLSVSTSGLASDVELELCDIAAASSSSALCVAIVDSGTSLTAVPKTMFRDLMSTITSAYSCVTADSGLLVCDCRAQGLASFPVVTISVLQHLVDGASYTTVDLTLMPDDYLITANDEFGRPVSCAPAFMELDRDKLHSDMGVLILGDYVMRSYLTEFDAAGRRVGFARSFPIEYAQGPLFPVSFVNAATGCFIIMAGITIAWTHQNMRAIRSAAEEPMLDQARDAQPSSSGGHLPRMWNSIFGRAHVHGDYSSLDVRDGESESEAESSVQMTDVSTRQADEADATAA